MFSEPDASGRRYQENMAPVPHATGGFKNGSGEAYLKSCGLKC